MSQKLFEPTDSHIQGYAAAVAPDIPAALDGNRFDRLGELSRLAGVLWLQLGEAAYRSDPHAARIKLAQICSVTISAHEIERAFGKGPEADQ